MIPRVRKGSNFRGLFRYLFAERGQEHREDPRRIDGNTVGADAGRLAGVFASFAEQNWELTRPVWHASLRAAPDDRLLDDAEWARAARVFLQHMGMVGAGLDATDVPYAVIRHSADHVHIVASRVRFDGRSWDDSHDYRRSHLAARVVEREFGLRDASQVRAQELSMVSRAEREKAARDGIEPERIRLRRIIELARDTSGGTRQGFELALTAAGVLYRANVASTGRMAGYSFGLEGWHDAAGEQIWLRASQVHRALRWSQLEADLGVIAARGADKGIEVGPSRDRDDVGRERHW